MNVESGPDVLADTYPRILSCLQRHATHPKDVLNEICDGCYQLKESMENFFVN
jgi:hypothetical protein